MEILNNFSVSKKSVNGHTTYLLGTYNNVPSVIVLHHQRLDASQLKECLNLPREQTRSNDIYSSFKITIPNKLKYTLISPVNEKLITKLDHGWCFVRETYEDYLKNREKMEEDDLFVRIRKRESAVPVCFENQDGIMLEENHTHQEKTSSWIVYLKDSNIRSVRDISNVEIIKSLKASVLEYCTSKEIPANEIVLFFDIGCKFYPLHFKVCSAVDGMFDISYDGWPLTVDELIKNLNINKDFYKDEMFYLRPRSAFLGDVTE